MTMHLKKKGGKFLAIAWSLLSSPVPWHEMPEAASAAVSVTVTGME